MMSLNQYNTIIILQWISDSNNAKISEESELSKLKWQITNKLINYHHDYILVKW